MKPLGFVTLLVTIGAAFAWNAAEAQFLQQGPKLVGSGSVGNAQQGWSASISGDGNTAIIGGFCDNPSGGASCAGAAWIFARIGVAWTQQGTKLVGTGFTGSNERFGWSVAVSADGNTALVGGPSDGVTGAVWVYVRSGSIWTQQGGKLVGSGAVGFSYQGGGVALSADGNTAVIGGPSDNSDTGAAWVFTRSGSAWTQQGAKLVGTGVAGVAHEGNSVALSADGNTAVIGGPFDNAGLGAAWIFTRSGGVWTQQGPKLVGAGGVSEVQQGYSVALSGDGNTAIVGGCFDNSNTGAAWIFNRTAGTWTQQGQKLIGAGAVGPTVNQGCSVAMSGDGNTALVGGLNDNNGTGATWVFTRSVGAWAQSDAKLVGRGATGGATQGRSVALSSNGSTAIVGGDRDDDSGAAWIFTRSATSSEAPIPTLHPLSVLALCGILMLTALVALRYRA